MRSYTDTDLTRIRHLRQQLNKAVPHSKEAVALGRQIMAIDQQAYMRRRGTITPQAGRALTALAKRLGMSD